MNNLNFNPFEMTEQDIRLMAGELTVEEMRCVKAVLRGIRNRLHQPNLSSGLTHAEGCWSWGPTHYMCAYERITEINRKRPALSIADLMDMAAKLNMMYDDVERVARAVEQHHVIGGSR